MLSRLLRGSLFGIGATLSMSAFMALARRAGVLGEPPPHIITKALLRKANARPSPKESVPAAWVLHFLIGASLGALHALVLDETDQASLIASGMYGTAVFATAYGVALPQLDLMPTTREDRRGRPAAMWLAHLIFGASLAAEKRFSQRARR
jgi:hypothetical protein